MPAVRQIKAVPNLGTALAVGRDPNTTDEAWLVDTNATAEQIVKAAAEYLAIDNARCEELSHAGQLRALWLLLAVIVGLVLPSPLRHLYGAQHWLLHATEIVGYIAVTVLLGLTWRENRTMRRLRD